MKPQPSNVQVTRRHATMSFQINTAFDGMSHLFASPSLSVVSSCATSCFSIASNESSMVFFGPGAVNLLLAPASDASSPRSLQSPSPRLISRANTASDDSQLDGVRFSMSPKHQTPRLCASSKYNGPLALTRDFACIECPLSFHRNHDLRRHNRSVHGIGKKTFVCKMFVSYSWKYSFNSMDADYSVVQNVAVMLEGKILRQSVVLRSKDSPTYDSPI
ncbi:hypothetical protein BC830DRAFT_1214183 [Chytriomyces sp. MP71]|nr:hypothetical protein BC830DRAFT_1214183 [Chytriomyces sp. MP71]